MLNVNKLCVNNYFNLFVTIDSLFKLSCHGERKQKIYIEYLVERFVL